MKIVFKILGNIGATLGILFRGPYWLKDWFGYDVFVWPQWMKITSIILLALLCIVGAILTLRVSDNSTQADSVTERAVENTSAIAQGVVIGAVTATIVGALLLSLIIKNNDNN